MKKVTKFLGSAWGQRALLLIVICVVMAICEPKFFLGSNFSSILLAIAIYGIMACGMLFTVLVGGMDLSVGSMAALAGTLLAIVTIKFDYSPAGFLLGFLLAMTVSLLVGFIHGILVTRIKIPAFVVTLATKYLIYGVVLLITNSSYIYLEARGLTYLLGNLRIGSISMPIIIFAIVALISIIILNFTVYGRRLYATGGNMKASELIGIKARRNVICAFIISSLAAGLGGMVLVSMNMVAGSGTASGYEGNVLMAMIVGGINLAGGEGGVAGAVFGALLVGIINNIQVLIGVPSDYQSFVQGVIILAALALNIYTQRRSMSFISGSKSDFFGTKESTPDQSAEVEKS
jgi:ribose transport system permease protein